MYTRHGGHLDWVREHHGGDPSGLLDFSVSLNPLGPPSDRTHAITIASHFISTYPVPEGTECGR
jgi:histidinol-phosphate/aromatic aminotransferase/cobyric acid decarboxylase-like protein